MHGNTVYIRIGSQTKKQQRKGTKRTPDTMERREPMAGRNTALLYGLGGRIRKSRNERGLTLMDLAVAVGSDKSALARIERGERVPGLETVGRLADVMGVSMADWFQEEPSSNTDVMGRFMESRNSRLERLSADQLTSLQAMIDQVLCMAGV